FSSRRRHTRYASDWSSDVCSSDLIHARVTLASTGILRYEVTDWGGVVPDQVEVDAASSDGERFYGLGEKFDTLDQAGKLAHVDQIGRASCRERGKRLERQR